MLLETDHCQFSHIDHCSVTFDHFVPADDPDQEYSRSTSLKWTMTEENMRTEGNTRMISCKSDRLHRDESTRRSKMLSAQERHAGPQANTWFGRREG